MWIVETDTSPYPYRDRHDIALTVQRFVRSRARRCEDNPNKYEWRVNSREQAIELLTLCISYGLTLTSMRPETSVA